MIVYVYLEEDATLRTILYIITRFRRFKTVSWAYARTKGFRTAQT